MFYWSTMKSDVLSMVQQCVICRKAKPDRSRYPGLLHPLPVPKSSWDVISMDFVEGLARSDNANAILVVIDKFTKFVLSSLLHAKRLTKGYYASLAWLFKLVWPS